MGQLLGCDAAIALVGDGIGKGSDADLGSVVSGSESGSGLG